MIGLGIWKFSVDTMFYRGDALLKVRDINGIYDIKCELTDVELPPVALSNLVEEGSTVTGTAATDLLKGKEIPFSVTFDGDSASGYLKVPFIGKIRMKDGHRIG